jgi:hypothetical protein
MKRALFSAVGVVALIMLAGVDAVACTCAVPDPGLPLKRQVRMALNESRAVFSGKVLEVTEDTETLSVVVRIKVERVWKGSPPAQVSIFTGRGGGDCGYGFEVGESYLVYAHKRGEDGLGTNICQRTAKLSEASKDLRALGRGGSVPRPSRRKGMGRS